MNTFLIRKFTPVAALLGLGLSACQPDLEDDFKPSSGSADFSRYIAVGNSLTAGFSDGGLYLEGQLNSYPNLLAQQFREAGGGDFVQPLFSEAQSNGSGYLRLAGFTAAGAPITASVTDRLALRAGATAARPLYTKYTEPVNNLGVPGIRLSDIETAGYAQGNPYFERITPDAQVTTQTYLARVAASNPTFFTNWLGNNDVLGYATAGGAANSLTTPAVFTEKNTKIIDALTANGAKGLVATIPDVTNIPFFTTVGPTFKATLTTLNVPGLVIQTGSAAGGPTSGNRKQITTADIRDASGTGRQLFTLTSSPFLGLLNQRTGRAWRYVYAQSGQPAAGLSLFLTAYGIDTTATFGTSAGNPIPSLFVLDDVEQGLVRTATTAFNNTIRSKANEKGLAIFDANAYFTSVAGSGIVSNGVNNTASFISGNLFSLDGVHPTPRGYAFVANEMIKAINAKYGSKIGQVNPNNYRGVRFPQ
ncbi:phospholipase/lecithinase/hemolysin [Hymenobacter luteus]|uniref:Phospholipase/lecithinase/hemolysin n=2 Tax=Hymenobacter TaxID=89966 RepID=A0A7W9T272_9BACT|nr:MULTISPECIES: G-D-S-L family lipolytic protein [Hymenobacter]MBB4602330.1 phospholipase/lecithinase/hemolysin [Hymenobacter latericoloratus]MBB6060222.1 phospholipase/lecithinase/hemolysin [Hymenobacter luteus]